MDTIHFACVQCGKRIEPATGALGLSHDDLMRAMKGYASSHQARNRKGSDNQGSLVNYLENVGRWNATHYNCAGEGQLSGYSIELDRLRTYRHLVAWTAHLMEKTWLPHTNWRHVLRHFAAQTE